MGAWRSRAAGDLRVEYPIALDSDYGVWQDFGNRYWPAVYLADAQGRIRYHHFGEGDYEECERAIQMLLREAGVEGVGDELVPVAPAGFEVQADWENLGSPETYLGYEQGRGFASPGGIARDEAREYAVPDSLQLNQWALAGEWTVEAGGIDVDDDGRGTITEPRLYQLIRGGDPIATDRTFEIEFAAAGVEAYVFTFG